MGMYICSAPSKICTRRLTNYILEAPLQLGGWTNDVTGIKSEGALIDRILTLARGMSDSL